MSLTISSFLPPKMYTLCSYATAVCPTKTIFRLNEIESETFIYIFFSRFVYMCIHIIFLHLEYK